MKKLLSIAALSLVAVTLFGQTQSNIKLNKSVGVDNNDSPVLLSTQKENSGKHTLKLATIPVLGATIDRSGAITSGGTSQQVAAANASRVYFEYQNISDETQYINFGAAATIDSNSFKVIPGGSYINPPNFCPNGIITVIGATTGKKFVAKEF